MIEDTYGGRIALGVDVGTSTCQAYLHVGDTRRMLFVEGAGQQDYFPSAILEVPGGTRMYGFSALLNAQQNREAVLHQSFKAFMKADPPLERVYTVAEAADLFQDMAQHFLSQLMPELQRIASSWTGKTRLDVSFTLPGGWSQDPLLTQTYHRVIYDLERALRAKLRVAGFDVFAYLVEEPVAALLGIESMYLPLPIDEPILVIDAGGGTLDAAVCVATRDIKRGVLRYTIPFAASIGVAGETLFEAFVKELQRSNSVTPPIPRRWRSDARMRAALRKLFQAYSLAAVDTYRDELSNGEDRFKVAFQPKDLEAKLIDTKHFRKIGKFIEGLLTQYNKITGANREKWGASYLVGGLGRYPLFKKTIQAVLPDCQPAPNPQEIIAMGAVSHAQKGGTQIHQRACPYHLGQQVQDLTAGKLVWSLLVRQGELISSSTAGERTYIGDSHVQFDSQGFKAAFGWTRSEDVEDTELIIAEHIISFREFNGQIRMLRAGDPLQTRVRFDDKLQIEIEVVHQPSGLTWSTAGLRW
ncbi:MAG: hypothetical protein AAFV53_05530 [Myxococcota bacterium]